VQKNLPQDIAVASNFLAVTKNVTVQKPLIHRHFSIASAVARKIARAEIFLPRRCADGVVARRLRKPERAITHKI
jgi:hypothetical protein